MGGSMARHARWRAPRRRRNRTLYAGVLAVLFASGRNPAQGAPPLQFVRQDYPTAVTPAWVSTADFNGDTHLDLAVSIYGLQDVAHFRGDGQGGFTFLGLIGVGIGPWGSVAVDLDADDDADLATANAFSNDVSILIGNGQGDFTALAPVPVGRYPRAILAARFNADPHLDLAVSNLLDDTVSILLGNGQGAFTPGVLLVGGNGPGAGGSADFNGDGHADLAIGNQNSHDVSVWLGQGNGTFGQPQSLPVVNHPHSAAVGRLDEDAHFDIVADNVNSDPAVVSVFHGDGGGGFALSSSHATGDSAPVHLIITDLNGDERADIAAVCRLEAGRVSVLVGDGFGGFAAPASFPVAVRPNGLCAGDFDEDGREDLAVANLGNSRLSILLNRTADPMAVDDGGESAPEASPVRLSAPLPNPFHPIAHGFVRVDLELAVGAPVSLRVFTPGGRLVRQLSYGDLAPGVHDLRWDGRDTGGHHVGAGAFMIEVMAGEVAERAKLIVVR